MVHSQAAAMSWMSRRAAAAAPYYAAIVVSDSANDVSCSWLQKDPKQAKDAAWLCLPGYPDKRVAAWAPNAYVALARSQSGTGFAAAWNADRAAAEQAAMRMAGAAGELRLVVHSHNGVCYRH